MRSLYVRIAKKDRKFIKGGRWLSNNLDSFLTESGQHHHSSGAVFDDDEDEQTTTTIADHELDIYLMSHAHLGLNHESVGRPAGSSKSSSNRHRLRLRFVNNSTTLPTPRHCVCEKLRKTSRRINTKYLLIANVLRTRALVEGDPTMLGPGGELKRRYKYRRDKSINR